MANISNTQYFKVNTDPEYRVKRSWILFMTQWQKKGYNPVNQIARLHYVRRSLLISPVIKMQRSMIMKVERDELVEELLKEYIKNRTWEQK